MKKSKKFQYGNVLTISLAHLSHDLYSSFLAPILPLLIAKLGIPLSYAGFLDVVRKLPSLFNPLIGLIADKVSVKYFIIISPAITAISMSLLGIAPSYPIVLILLLVAGISNTLFHVPSPVIVKNVSGDQIGKGMSYYMLGGELARTLGPLLITTAISLWGLEGSWRVMPIGLVASLILYIKLRNVSGNKVTKREKGAWDTVKKHHKFFGLITCISMFRATMHISLTLYLPTYLVGQGKSLWLSGIAIALLQLAGAVGTFFAGPLSDRFGRKKILLMTSIANPILMWLFVASDTMLRVPILIVIGFSLFATGPILLALVQDTGTERPSLMNGVYMALTFGIGSLISVLIGVVGDWLGLNMAFQISSFTALGAIPFVLMLKDRKA
jgi:FSR family fosmidomycin resistance protein-like MFS transporter